MASIVHGQNRTTSPALNGKTVTEARCAWKAPFNIPDTAVPTVNGVAANGDTRLREGDELVFAAPTGQKG